MADLVSVLVGAVSLVLWICVYIPFIAYHLLRMYNFRGDITLSKRYPAITVVTVSCIIVWILSFSLEVTRLFFDGPSILGTVYNVAAPVFSFSYSCSIWWRFWLSHFVIEFSVSTASQKWQQFIDQKAQHKNWYFLNKETYGDYTWTKKRFLAVTALLVVVFLTLSFWRWLNALRVMLEVTPWIFVL